MELHLHLPCASMVGYLMKQRDTLTPAGTNCEGNTDSCTLKMEARGSSDVLKNVYQSVRRRIAK